MMSGSLFGSIRYPIFSSRRNSSQWGFWFTLFPWLLPWVGCSALDLQPRSPSRVVARFDPEQGSLPMPNDLLRDDKSGRLDLPIDDPAYSAAEVALRGFLNRHDGWSSAAAGRVEFSAPIDPSSLDPRSVQIWAWGPSPESIPWRWKDPLAEDGFEGPLLELNEERTRLTLNPPRHGWKPGGQYVMVVRGGSGVTMGMGELVRDPDGFSIETDVAFFFLRARDRLDGINHNRAFPGETVEERRGVAEDLERARQKVSRFLDFLEGAGPASHERTPREQVAALWSFTVTRSPELAMDRSSQRVPIPFDPLFDPDTGRLDLTPSRWDSALERSAKSQLNRQNGFGLSSNLMFEFTSAVDPRTLNKTTVKLLRLEPELAEIPLAEIRVMTWEQADPCVGQKILPDCKYVSLSIQEDHLPLAPATAYAVVLGRGIRGADGQEVVPMSTGFLLGSELPLVMDGKSQLSSIADDLAARLERSRTRLAGLLDGRDRKEILAAWSFTTLDPFAEARRFARAAELQGIAPDPEDVTVREVDPADQTQVLTGLLPGELGAVVRALYTDRVADLGQVVEGAIRSPYFLDRRTRAIRTDGGYEEEKIRFLMTLPRDVPKGKKLPVVIFGHAVVTDKRFLLGFAGALAKRGFAAVSIDFPFHGERTVCVPSSLVALPNFLPPALQTLTGFTDGVIFLPPCVSGSEAKCAPTGECLDKNGQVEPFSTFYPFSDQPELIDLKPASGAAFLDIHDVPHINDHLLQALVDLGALKRSLKSGRWSEQIGVELDTDQLFFVGQSLGAIIGSVFTALEPDFSRIVLNVPGSDLVDLFLESEFFGTSVRDYFQDEKLLTGSFKQERFLNIARWLIDPVDPQTFGPLHQARSARGLIQIDCGLPSGDFVIPNRTSRLLQRLSGFRLKEYNSILHMDLIIPWIGDEMQDDLVRFLEEGKVP